MCNKMCKNRIFGEKMVKNVKYYTKNLCIPKVFTTFAR